MQPEDIAAQTEDEEADVELDLTYALLAAQDP